MSRETPQCFRRVWLAVLCGTAVTAAGCGAEKKKARQTTVAPAPGASFTFDPASFSVEQAKTFRGFPVYYVGESFRRLPLTTVYRYKTARGSPDARRQNFVSFIYGDCDASDHGCAPPLEVRSEPSCLDRPAHIQSPHEHTQTVRGVTATFFSRGTVSLVTGRTTVSIYARDRAEALAVARRLRGVNVPLRASSRLPPPPPRSFYRTCRK